MTSNLFGTYVFALAHSVVFPPGTIADVTLNRRVDQLVVLDKKAQVVTDPDKRGRLLHVDDDGSILRTIWIARTVVSDCESAPWLFADSESDWYAFNIEDERKTYIVAVPFDATEVDLLSAVETVTWPTLPDGTWRTTEVLSVNSLTPNILDSWTFAANGQHYRITRGNPTTVVVNPFYDPSGMPAANHNNIRGAVWDSAVCPNPIRCKTGSGNANEVQELDLATGAIISRRSLWPEAIQPVGVAFHNGSMFVVANREKPAQQGLPSFYRFEVQ